MHGSKRGLGERDREVLRHSPYFSNLDEATFAEVAALARPLGRGAAPPRDCLCLEVDAAAGRIVFDVDALRDLLARGLKGAPVSALVLALERHYLDQNRQLGLFTIYVISLLCAFMFLAQGIAELVDDRVGTTSVTLPLVLLFGIFVLRPLRQMGLPRAAYGITAMAWPQRVVEGVLAALPVIALSTLFKASFGSGPLLEPLGPLVAHYGETGKAWLHLFGYNGAYLLVVAPLQELIARGVLQGLLERLIPGPRRVAMAILVSNLVYGAFHLYLSPFYAAASFLLGMYLGWLYSRHHSLVAPTVAHGLSGVWFISVLHAQRLFG